MPAGTESEPELKPCTLAQLLVYFVKLGALGFGGPIALAGAMQRDLVDRQQWVAFKNTRKDWLSRSWRRAQWRLSWRFTSGGCGFESSEPPWSHSPSSCHRCLWCWVWRRFTYGLA